MVSLRKHWHFATKRTPEREARLLAFATGGNTPDPVQNPDENIPENPPTPEQQTNDESMIQGETREAVGNVLQPNHAADEGQEKIETLRASEVLNKMQAAQAQILLLQKRLADVLPKIKSHISKEDNTALKELETLLTVEHGNIRSWMHLAEGFANFENGTTHPIEFATWLRREMDEDGKNPAFVLARKNLLQELGSSIAGSSGKTMEALKEGDIPDVTERAIARDTYVQQLNESDRLTIAQNMLAGPMLQDTFQASLYLLNEQTTFVNSLVQGSDLDKKISSIEKVIQQAEQGDVSKQSGIINALKTFEQGLGIHRVSILQIIEGGKLWWKAYEDALNENTHHGGAFIASKLGKVSRVLPFGKDVEIVLERSLDSSDDEEKNKYLEYLKRLSPDFVDVIGGHGGGELALNANNGNRARAVLEYAATRGWLYDIEDSENLDSKRVLDWPLSKLVPKEWNQMRINNYFTTLRENNSAGAESERKKGNDKVKTSENIPFFIQEMDNDLNSGNLWFARGIAERALERGLINETSPWLAVTIMRHLFDNPIVRKYAKPTTLDKFGDIAFYTSYFTQGFFKGERNIIYDAIRNKHATIADAGTLGKAIALLDAELRKKSPEIDYDKKPKDLDRDIAKVLAGGVIKRSGGVVSLMGGGDKYDFYRDITKFQGDLSPGVAKEDPDYYRQITENIFVGEAVVGQILAKAGNGPFKEPEKAAFYMGNILTYHWQLEQAGDKAAAERFRMEMGRKLSKWIMDPLGDARVGSMPDQLMKGAPVVHDKKGITALLLNGFLDIQTLTGAIWNKNNGRIISDKVLREVSVAKTGNSRLYDKLIAAKDAYDKAGPDEKPAKESAFHAIEKEWLSLMPPVTWDRAYITDPITLKQGEYASNATDE